MDTNKKKAILYTALIVLGVASFCFLIINFPIIVSGVCLFILSSAMIYILYKTVLDHLDDKSINL